MPIVRVIGLGNTLMGDDGVGVRVAEELASRDLGPDTEVVNGGTDGMALTRHFVEADAVIVIDAITTGDEPGSVFRFRPEDVQMERLRSHTSHGLSLPAILFATQLQGELPLVIVYAIEICNTACGFDTLSPDVEAAVPEVAEMVAGEALILAGVEAV